MVQDVPGVYTEMDKTGQNTISMRGLGSTYTLILIDGKRQNVNQQFISSGLGNATSFMPPPSMIERVEVIRGPAGVIYGSEAMGGVINIITKKHTNKVSGGIQLETKISEATDWNTVQSQIRNNQYITLPSSNIGDNLGLKEWGNAYGINAYINTPLIKNRLSLNVRGAYRYNEPNMFFHPIGSIATVRNGSTTQPSQDSRGGNPYAAHSATGSYNWNAGFRLNYTPNEKNYIYLDSEFYNGRFGTLNTSSSSFATVNDTYKTNNILSHDGKYEWGKLSTYAQYSYTAYAPHGSHNPYPSDSTLQGLAPGENSGDFINWASRRENHNAVFQSAYNNDWDFGKAGALIFNGGIYYMYETLRNYSSRFFRGAHQAAIFAEGEYLINQYVGMTLGLRYNYSNLFSAIPNPRFYVNVNPTEWLTFKAGIASGSLIPQLSYLYDGYTISTSGSGSVSTPQYIYGNTNLRPETSWNYELSAIFDFDPAMLVLTGYYTDFRDKVQSVDYYGGVCENSTTSQTCVIYSNVDKALVTGGEASFNLKPKYFGIGLDASYGFTYTKRLDSTAYGEPLNSIPRHNFIIKPSYTYKDFNIYLRWSGKFATPTPYAAGNARTNVRRDVGMWYKDYQILDLGASLKLFKNYTITFAVNNLLNVYFVDYAYYYRTTSSTTPTSGQNRYQRILPSRNFWISLRADF